MPDKLTPKQEQFCREYLIDLNATQACIRAGYSPKTAKQMGTENLSKPAIQAYLAEINDVRFERVKMDADAVLLEASDAFNVLKTQGDYKTAKGYLELIAKHRDVGALREHRVVETRPYEDLTDEELDRQLANEEDLANGG